MVDIDYGLAFDFLDDAGRPLQLRFRRNYAPPGDPRLFADTGQLIAILVDRHRPDDGDIVAISRPNVERAQVEKVIENWESWAVLTDDQVNLSEIRRRVHAAGLG
ncbi:MAG: hypothetical protein PHQ28_13940 [Mycobacterium sp.]|nr:hypothetical protein [Mycobacterium sp.]